jgi:hypothetical protein
VFRASAKKAFQYTDPCPFQSVELKVVSVERDLLKERVAAFERKIFAASSEAHSANQPGEKLERPQWIRQP